MIMKLFLLIFLDILCDLLEASRMVRSTGKILKRDSQKQSLVFFSPLRVNMKVPA